MMCYAELNLSQTLIVKIDLTLCSLDSEKLPLKPLEFAIKFKLWIFYKSSSKMWKNASVRFNTFKA